MEKQAATSTYYLLVARKDNFSSKQVFAQPSIALGYTKSKNTNQDISCLFSGLLIYLDLRGRLSPPQGQRLQLYCIKGLKKEQKTIFISWKAKIYLIPCSWLILLSDNVPLSSKTLKQLSSGQTRDDHKAQVRWRKSHCQLVRYFHNGWLSYFWYAPIFRSLSPLIILSNLIFNNLFYSFSSSVCTSESGTRLTTWFPPRKMAPSLWPPMWSSPPTRPGDTVQRCIGVFGVLKGKGHEGVFKSNKRTMNFWVITSEPKLLRLV